MSYSTVVTSMRRIEEKLDNMDIDVSVLEPAMRNATSAKFLHATLQPNVQTDTTFPAKNAVGVLISIPPRDYDTILTITDGEIAVPFKFNVWAGMPFYMYLPIFFAKDASGNIKMTAETTGTFYGWCTFYYMDGAA